MSTLIRAELSGKNPYWIEKHRYYELKHFCMQYPIWRKAYESLDGLSKRPLDLIIFSNDHGDPTSRCAEARQFYKDRMDMVKDAAYKADPVIGNYIFEAVTNGISWEILNVREKIPCCKGKYYELYRRFFWILNNARK